MAGLTFGKRRKRIHINYELILKVAGWFFQIALVCFLAFLLVWYFGREASVIGNSMNPQLQNGDVILVNRLVYDTRKPRRGEVIAFWPNGNENAHASIKRVIALPGETITCKEGKLYIDGELLEEDYPTTELANLGTLEEPVVLKAGEYFVLGDDRESSEDSRDINIGNVQREEIIGKVWFVCSPLKHIGLVR